MRALAAVRMTELTAPQNLLYFVALPRDGNEGRIRKVAEVVLTCGAKAAKEDFQRLGRLQRVPSVDAVLGELAREATKNETAQPSSIHRALRVVHAVRDAPW